MTRDDTIANHNELAGLSRLQLQALCVKVGLDTTAENEELRRNLQEHWNQNRRSQDGNHSILVAQKQEGVSDSDKTGTTGLEEEIKDTKSVIENEVNNAESDHITEMDENIKIEDDNTEVNTEVKTEEVLPELQVSENLEQFGEGDVSIKSEIQEEESMVIDSESPLTVKQEHDELSIKLEDNSTDAEVKMESTEETIKIEDTTIPIAQRKQFWESKTTSTRSTLPINGDRLTNQVAKGAKRTISQPQQTNQKRGREAEENEANSDNRDEEGGNSSNSLPTPGTVRSLIGKFAGSTISPPGTPLSKRRKVEIVKSSTVPSPIPVIPRYKRVIKIPVAGTVTNKSSYALGTSKTSKSTMAARRKITSASPASSPVPSVKKTTMSAETINRLATPKKVSTAPAPGAGAMPVAAASASTTTRPRGPILSTASRAAQRRNREKK